MLGKLIKYDLKYGVRIFVILQAFLLAACILGRFTYMRKLDFNAPPTALFSSLLLFASLYILLISSISFGTLILITVRFYKNLFSDEGYLSWTLPATACQQLWAKICSGAFWYIINILTTALGILILVTDKNVVAAYSQIAPEVTRSLLGIPLPQFGFWLLISSLISTISSLLMIYASIAIGQLFPSHRVMGAFISYFIIYFVTMIMTVIGMLTCNITLATNTQTATPEATMSNYLLTSFILALTVTIITGIIEYIITHYIFTRKLNLN